MPLFHLVLVALIQGVTEFLPISSSGHLVLLPALTGFEDQGQLIDVAVHVGTLFAVCLYFRHDVARAFAGLVKIRMGAVDADSRLALNLIVATVPIILIGLFVSVIGNADAFRSIAVIGWTTLIFGILLWWADRTGQEKKRGDDWTLGDAFFMGLWQTIALIPGTSRSGITITGARRLGYQRSEAARLAMLMSIPTIAAAGLLVGADAAMSADGTLIRDMIVVAVLAFLSALAALHFMMRLLTVASFTPYVIYRIILGTILLIIAYT